MILCVRASHTLIYLWRHDENICCWTVHKERCWDIYTIPFFLVLHTLGAQSVL